MANKKNLYYKTGNKGNVDFTDRWDDLKPLIDFNPNHIVLDVGCAEGLIAIELAKQFKQVYAFEINPIRCQMGRENVIRVLNIENVDIRCGNSIQLIKNFKNWLKYIGVNKVNLIHSDFPWGGVNYSKKSKIDDLYLENINYNYEIGDYENVEGKKMGIYDMIKKISPYTDFISLKLPFNFDIKTLKKKVNGKINIYNISKKIIMVIIET